MTLDEIWADDLFGRREEAALLIGYLECVADRKALGEDGHGYTLAIDAGYGVGKSFFLRRLARQLASNHPVAFVDAWADDLADEPLTALASTLKNALDPLMKSSTSLRDKWAGVADKAGKVALIATKGVARRALEIALTGGAVEAMGHVVSGAGEAAGEAMLDRAAGTGEAVVGEALKAFDSVAPGKVMEGRIAQFEQGRKAIEDTKASLRQLVAELEKTDRSPPIFIIIDELDRCRPTYAVKLLEEIKHLFDVPGLVFVFGLHGEQLARSVAGAYGPDFDGQAYLRRFINRRYTLPEPDLEPLVQLLLDQARLSNAQLRFPAVNDDGRGFEQEPPARTVARYMSAYELSARDAFRIVDMLQTCAGLTKYRPLMMPLLLPLLIGRLLGQPRDRLATPAHAPATWSFAVEGDDFRSSAVMLDFWYLAQTLHAYAKSSNAELNQAMNREQDRVAMMMLDATTTGEIRGNPMINPRRYAELLERVGRFGDPAQPAS